MMDPAAAIKSMAEHGSSSKYITTFVAAAKLHGWKGLPSRRREFCHFDGNPLFYPY